MPWQSFDSLNLTKEQKEAFKKFADETNKAWGEKNERERRERVGDALGFKKDEKAESKKVNNSKSPKM